MGIPLDIEDILGTGCIASIGRALTSLSCLWLGAATGIVAVSFGSLGAELLQGGGLPVDLMDFLMGVCADCAFGPLVLFRSYTFFFFFPLVLAVYFVFARGDNGTLTKWVVYAAITGALALLSFEFLFDGNLLALLLSAALWIALIASLATGAFLLTGWQRRHMAMHLLGVAAENDQRRQEISETFGTAVGDREFATGDLHVVPPSSEVSRPKPEPPLPGSKQDDK